MVSLKFLPCWSLLPRQRILGQKLTIARPTWKIIACCFHLHPYFCTRAIRWCHLSFSPADPCCHGNEFWVKIDYNSAPWKIIAPSLHLPPYTQLLVYIAWQWDRYIIVQNVFLVLFLKKLWFLDAGMEIKYASNTQRKLSTFFFSKVQFIRLVALFIYDCGIYDDNY